MYVLCLNFEVSVSEVCFYEKYCYKWEYYNYEFFNSKNCHLPDLYVPTEMLVYKVNNKVVAGGYEQRGRSMIHGCPIPTGHVCMMVTSVHHVGIMCHLAYLATHQRMASSSMEDSLLFLWRTVSSYNESRWFSSCLTLQFLNI